MFFNILSLSTMLYSATFGIVVPEVNEYQTICSCVFYDTTISLGAEIDTNNNLTAIEIEFVSEYDFNQYDIWENNYIYQGYYFEETFTFPVAEIMADVEELLPLKPNNWFFNSIQYMNIWLNAGYSIEEQRAYCVYDFNANISFRFGSTNRVYEWSFVEALTCDFALTTSVDATKIVDMVEMGNFYYDFNTDFREEVYNYGYGNGYEDGASVGYGYGYDDGYEDGYDDGEIYGNNKKYDFLKIIEGAFNSVSDFFNMEIFPGVKFIYIIGIPIVIAVLRFVIGWFR